MKTLIDVLAALSDFVKVASEWAESASKAEVETFTQIYPQKEETVKKAVEKAVTLEEVRSVLANLSRSGQKETVLKLLQKHGGSRLSEVPPGRYAALFADAQEAAHAEKTRRALCFFQCSLAGVSAVCTALCCPAGYRDRLRSGRHVCSRVGRI